MTRTAAISILELAVAATCVLAVLLMYVVA